MSEQKRSIGRSILHAFERVFDALGARPWGILFFIASVVLLLSLEMQSYDSVRAPAVARAAQVTEPAQVASFVLTTYVHAGDTIQVGTPLVELSPHFIDREIIQLDAEIETLVRESNLAQARLMVDEQRWLAPNVRLRPDKPSLEDPTRQLFATELAAVKARRRQLLEDREHLIIKSSRGGRVVHVVTPGTAIAAGGPVATLTSEYAEEIVAYVPATTGPHQIRPGATVRISGPMNACPAMTGAVLRRGAGVEEAPSQLQGFLRIPVHGMPIYISVPEGCELAVGQTLDVELPRSVM